MELIASARGHATGGTTVDTGTTLDILAGDVLVAYVAGDYGSSLSSVAEDDNSNSFTVLGNTSEWWRVGSARLLSAAASSGATIRATLSAYASSDWELIVLQFRPASGETVSFGSGPASASNVWGSNPTSGQLSTSSAKSVFVGCGSNGHATLSNPRIGGVSVDGSVYAESINMVVGYTIYGTTQSNIAFAATSGEGTWGAQMMCLEYTESSGGHPTASRFRNMHRNNSVRYA
jgi:hypothetical protein